MISSHPFCHLTDVELLRQADNSGPHGSFGEVCGELARRLYAHVDAQYVIAPVLREMASQGLSATQAAVLLRALDQQSIHDAQTLCIRLGRAEAPQQNFSPSYPTQ